MSLLIDDELSPPLISLCQLHQQNLEGGGAFLTFINAVLIYSFHYYSDLMIEIMNTFII